MTSVIHIFTGGEFVCVILIIKLNKCYYSTSAILEELFINFKESHKQ